MEKAENPKTAKVDPIQAFASSITKGVGPNSKSKRTFSRETQSRVEGVMGTASMLELGTIRIMPETVMGEPP